MEFQGPREMHEKKKNRKTFVNNTFIIILKSKIEIFQKFLLLINTAHHYFLYISTKYFHKKIKFNQSPFFDIQNIKIDRVYI